MSNVNRKTALSVGVGVALSGFLVALLADKYSRRNQPLSLRDFQAMLNERGQLHDLPKLLHKVSHRGVAPDARAQVWPYLLGLFEPQMSSADVDTVLAAMEEGFSKLLEHCTELQGELQRSADQGLYGDPGLSAGPLRTELAQFKEAQRVIVLDAVRTNFKETEKSSVLSTAASVRSQAQQEAAGPSAARAPAGSASSSFQRAGSDGLQPLERPSWLPASLWEEVVCRDHLTEADRRMIVRLCSVLTAYAVRDPEIGYCQGMSDLATVFVLVFDNDALAFWCFERFMRRVRANYKIDDFGYRAVTSALYRTLQEADFVLHSKLRQLGAQECMFAFRMVMCVMRREVPLEGALTIWEVLWTDDLQQELEKEAETNRRSRDTGAAARQYLETPRWNTPRMHGQEASTSRADNASPENTARQGPSSSTGTSTHVTPRPVALDNDLFVYILAAVATSQRRRILDDCSNSDDVSRVFFTPMRLNVWRIIDAAKSYRKQRQSAAAHSAPAVPRRVAGAR